MRAKLLLQLCVRVCAPVTLLPALFVPSYRQHITSIMLPITISLSSHLKASGFSSISICTHFNRVHYHLLPMEQLCLLANLFSCMFSYCPPGVSHGSTMKQWVLPPHSNSCSLLVPGDPGASKSCPALVCWSAAVSTTSSCVVQGWITRASQQRRLSFFFLFFFFNHAVVVCIEKIACAFLSFHPSNINYIIYN